MEFKSDRLRDKRKALKLSQTELAARIGIDQRQISYLESGHANPTATTLASLAEALGVSVDWLLGLTELSGLKVREVADLDEFEYEVIQFLRSKPPERRRKILDAIKLLD